jgi:hypothetical protein
MYTRKESAENLADNHDGKKTLGKNQTKLGE